MPFFLVIQIRHGVKCVAQRITEACMSMHLNTNMYGEQISMPTFKIYGDIFKALTQLYTLPTFLVPGGSFSLMA